MGAWIEIAFIKFCKSMIMVAPHDGCVDWNLKPFSSISLLKSSHPTMGAWIEIVLASVGKAVPRGRTPRWVRGLKLLLVELFQWFIKSHPTMGAWIEIRVETERNRTTAVAPHDGCVDWNQSGRNGTPFCFIVAPHDGCVDWNNEQPCSRSIWRCRTPRWVRGLK